MWPVVLLSFTFALFILFLVVNYAGSLIYNVSTTIPEISLQTAVITNNSFNSNQGNVAGISESSSNLTPESANTQQSIVTLDPRAYVFEEYFRRNNSPMQGTGEIFVNNCIKYQMPRDCITIVAIARAETDLCKYGGSDSYFNCWGFGGGGIYRMRFTSWEESIDRVSRSLAWSYGERFILDPRRMERTFCGWEPGCTGWGARVLFFVNEIDRLGVELGVGSLLAMR